MGREQCGSVSGWMLKLGRQGLVLVASGLMVTTVGIATMASSVQDQIPSNNNRSMGKPMIIVEGNIEAEADRLRKEGKQLLQKGTDESRRQAIEIWKKAIQIYLKIDPEKGSPYPLLLTEMIGRVYYELNEFQQSVDYLEYAVQTYRRVRQNPEVQRTISESWRQAFLDSEIKALNLLSRVCMSLGDSQKFSEYREEELKLYWQSKSKEQLANFLQETGVLYRGLGEWDKARDAFEQALSIFKKLDSQKLEIQLKIASIYVSISRIYRQLGNSSEQGVFLGKAYDIYFNFQNYPIFTEKSTRGLAFRDKLMSQFADLMRETSRFHYNQGDVDKALRYLDRQKQALEFADDKDTEALASNLSQIGIIHYLHKNEATGIQYLHRALEIISKESQINTSNISNRVRRALKAKILQKVSVIYYKQRDLEKSLEYSQEILEAYIGVGDLEGQVGVLFNIAVGHRDQGKPIEALKKINAAIKIVERLRKNSQDDDLRTSYFAQFQHPYALKIDLLMQLHQQQPQKGYDKQAMETSDRARARSLIELLTESRADIRKGVGDDLLKREKELQQKLDATEKRFTQLTSNSATQAQAVGIQQEIKDLYQAQNQLKDEIRKESPAYAQLKYPEPLKLAEIQQQLDGDTVLLQYSLGEERSYLWAVTKTGMTSYTLPKRSDIEKSANQFRDLLRDPGMQGVSPSDQQKGTSLAQTANQLSTLILAPAAAELKRNRRIVIVADGALHTIPFAALTVPGSDSTTYNPLVKHHEIVNLPSASTIAILRETVTKNRKPAPKTLALLADPVFSKEDDRFTGKLGKSPSLDLNLELEHSALNRATRNLNLANLSRLESSGKEATQILALVPPPQQLVATGFDATYDWATSPQLRQYRFLHFATHGLFDPKQPELSGLVFSRIDKQGNPRRDFLRLPDLFNLDLPAELIVLSACETGLGTVVQGEGIVGMTRGLMYAGTPRVVVSLWQVNDAATATLMGRFYQEIQQGKSPPVALQAAQQWMATQEAYQNPYSWAGFVVQGEWRWDAAVAKAATQ